MLLPDDRAIVERDATLGDRLASVLDDNRLLALVRERFANLQVAQLRGDYIRYKPATSCIVGFTGQTEKRQSFRGYAKALPDHVATFGFPHDATLPHLSVLGSPAQAADLWRELLKRDLPASAFDSMRVEPLAYKPERRFVGKLVDTDGAPLAAVKFYSRASFDRSLTNMRAVRSRDGLKIARRIGDSNRCQAIAIRWINSRPLALRDQLDPPPLASVERVGAALAALHGQSSDTLGLLTPTIIAGQVRSMLPLIDAIAPQCSHLANEIVERLVPLLQLPSPSSLVTVHGDFYANQVLIGSKRVTIVDSDELARGTAAFDLGNFIAQWYARIDCANATDAALLARVSAMAEALLAGHHAAAEFTINREDLHLYTAIGCLKLAARAFRRREPGWAGAIERILHRARAFANLLPTAAMRSAGMAHIAARSPSGMIHDPLCAMNDRVLSALLHVATDPIHVLPELQARVPELIDRPLRAIRITRHKQNRRCLVEYEFGRSARSAESYTIIGKIRAKGVDTAQAAIYQAIHDAGFSDNEALDGILVPQPLGTIPAMHMALQRKVAATPASQMLAEFDAPGSLLASRIARAIVKVHRANVPPRKQHTIDDEMRILDRALTTAAQARPQLSDRIATLAQECSALADPLRMRSTVCGIHRDFYPDQVLIAGARIYLIDFDLYCLGDPALDAGNFIAHLIDQSVRTNGGDPSQFDSQQREFLDEFVAQHGESKRCAVEMYTTLSLARLVAISTRMPERNVWTSNLLDVTRERMDAGVRS